jgi:hypothetical protein
VVVSSGKAKGVSCASLVHSPCLLSNTLRTSFSRASSCGGYEIICRIPSAAATAGEIVAAEAGCQETPSPTSTPLLGSSVTSRKIVQMMQIRPADIGIAPCGFFVSVHLTRLRVTYHPAV